MLILRMNRCYRLYVGSEKKDTKELICRTETDSHTLKTLWLPKGTGGGWGGVGGMDRGVGIGMCTLRCVE